MSGQELLDLILTIPETAEYLKLSKSKVYAMAQRGEIPTIRIGKNVRIRITDLKKWLEANSQPSRV
ncbi:MAG: helix-turn-helix domain-containing protein [Anaerolineae bacterium]|nr:helix-turn-helix domain-containing protein [Anaerolineae bacterium]